MKMPEIPTTKPASDNRETAIGLQKMAIDFLYRLNRAFRMSKIYELNNFIFRRQVKLLIRLIQDFYQNQKNDSFVLALRENSLFFNQIKIKFGFSSYYLLKFIALEFPKKEIGELCILPDITEDEIVRFIQSLAKKHSEEGEDPHELLLADLERLQITNIQVSKVSAFEVGGNKEAAAKKIFFLSLTHIKEFFEAGQEERYSLITTKRLMQSIFNHISDNESFLFGLTNIKNFDEYTLNHSVNVCILSIALGKKLGLDRKELVDLGLSAFFHDFGKLDIPKEILLKPGKLDQVERDIIEEHPYRGAEKLIQMREFSYLPFQALHVALEHHAHDADSGYPRYTRKKRLNFFSKIVKIADFFDAVTTPRPYRSKDYSREDALNLMLEKGGKEFDLLILKVFISMMGACPVGTVILLNTGEVGIVYEINPEAIHMLRPKIKIIADRDGNRIDGKVLDLADMDVEINSYRYSIVKTLDAKKYGIPISDYFLAEAQ